MLEAIALSKAFDGKKAVNSLNLTINPGEVFCLLGPNGAGKTTTINLILGFTTPTSGAVRVGGLDVQSHPLKTKKMLAYIPEQVMLYPNLSGLENLAYFTALSESERFHNSDLHEYLHGAGLQEEAHALCILSSVWFWLLKLPQARGYSIEDLCASFLPVRQLPSTKK